MKPKKERNPLKVSGKTGENCAFCFDGCDSLLLSPTVYTHTHTSVELQIYQKINHIEGKKFDFH